MLICGLKLTHDGAISLIENETLRVQIDTEKVDNNGRYASGDFDLLVRALGTEGLTPADIDTFVIDGWHPRTPGSPGEVTTSVHGFWRRLPLARYADPEDGRLLEGTRILSKDFAYTSYPHASGHVMAAYCTSPFAQADEDSFILVWDGGMRPHLYYWSAKLRYLTSLGPVLRFNGSVYADFASYFEPFVHESRPNRWSSWPELDRVAGLSCAGKVMAFSALGRVDRDLAAALARCVSEASESSESVLLALVRKGRTYRGPTEDLLATFQDFVGRSLVDALRNRVRDSPYDSDNLCFSGGCALNVTWNRRLRDSSGFRSLWIPPFPNDSGSALGAACAEMVASGGGPALEWDVYSGPRLRPSPVGGQRCSVDDLADLLHHTGEPVVVLHGRAELGPRALGNRSILAAPVNERMRHRLNSIKQRESYRPIAPICLEERASEIFDPGGRDPYMLYTHTIRPNWLEHIPAVAHVDDSARLQTVSDRESPFLDSLLRAYEIRSGVPVLCNTSANRNGAGFFPDVQSAIDWAGVRLVWSDGLLYQTPETGRLPTDTDGTCGPG